MNLRDIDNAALGIVSDRYKVVQNEDAFRFTDDLLGEGVSYETAGSLQGGRKVWMLAKMPHRYIIAGDEIAPYLVVMNSHDGSSGIKVAMTPIRVVCQNTLNLALNSAKRIWTMIAIQPYFYHCLACLFLQYIVVFNSTYLTGTPSSQLLILQENSVLFSSRNGLNCYKHTENVMNRVHEARETLQLAEIYMSELGKGIDVLSGIRLSDRKVLEFMQEFFPVTADLSDAQRKNNLRLLEDLKQRYFDAPDLSAIGKNGYRFINAVSDFATHAAPIRKTKNYNENLFLRTIEGNPMIDRAYKTVLSAA